MTTPHKHAEVIKAWADGKQIQAKEIDGNWFDITAVYPRWDHPEYRVIPARTYPTSLMKYKDLDSAIKGMRCNVEAGAAIAIANAALRHAIDAGQLVEPGIEQRSGSVIPAKMTSYGLIPERELAIANAVLTSCLSCILDTSLCLPLQKVNLHAIIASVKP